MLARTIRSVIPRLGWGARRPRATHDCVGHAGGADVRSDVVDPDDVGAARDPEARRREGRLETLVGGQVEHLAERRFATRTEQDRPTEQTDDLEPAKQLEVVLGCLAEAK